MESAANASCPKCLDQTVECDYFDGKRICLKCGFVLEDEDLVPSDERDAEGQTTTHYVPPSGIVPGGGQRGSRRAPSMPKEAGTLIMPIRLNTELTHLAQRLGCTRVIREDARHYMEHAYQRLRGSTRVLLPLDTLAAASLYLAVRMANLPWTLAETAHLIGRPVYELGQAYRIVMHALDRTPPAVDFQQFAQRHLAELKHFNCSALDKKLIMQNFGHIMTWTEQMQSMARHPSLVAAAIHLAAEACKVKISMATLGGAFMVSPKTISTHSFRVKTALLTLAEQLPWLKCNAKNVMQHLQTLLHMSSLHHAAAMVPAVGKEQDSGQPDISTAAVSNSASAELQAQSDISSQNVVHETTKVKRKAPSVTTDEVLNEPGMWKKRQRQTEGDLTADTKESLTSPKPPLPAADDKDESSLDGSVMGSDELRSYLRSPGEVQSLQKVMQHVPP